MSHECECVTNMRHCLELWAVDWRVSLAVFLADCELCHVTWMSHECECVTNTRHCLDVLLVDRMCCWLTGVRRLRRCLLSVSCVTSHEWATNTQVGHVTDMSGVWPLICDMTHSFSKCLMFMTHSHSWLIHVTWHDSFIWQMPHSHEKCLIHMWRASFIWDMTHSYVAWLIHIWHDSGVTLMHLRHVSRRSRWRVTWLIHMRHDSSICDMPHSYVTWLRCHTCAHSPLYWKISLTRDMTHLHVWLDSCMWHDSFICDMTKVSHLCTLAALLEDLADVWHDSLTCVTCLNHMWHASFICDMPHSICDMPHSYVTWLIHMWHASFICDMSHSNVTCLIRVWRDSFIRDMPHSHVTCLIRMRHASSIRDMPH